MKLPKVFIKKILLGGLLLVAAAAVSLFIKDSLDTRAPTSALPLMTVECNGSAISEDAAYLGEYRWNFWTSNEHMINHFSPEDVHEQLVPYNVLPQLPLSVKFSRRELDVKVSRAMEDADFWNSTDPFVLQEPDANGVLYTPPVPGTYVYKVEASFDRGSVVYYFGITVNQLY